MSKPPTPEQWIDFMDKVARTLGYCPLEQAHDSIELGRLFIESTAAAGEGVDPVAFATKLIGRKH